MSAARKYSGREILGRLSREVFPFSRHIAVLLLLSLVAMLLTLLNPWPLKLVVDSVLGTHELPAWFASILPAGVGRTDSTAIAYIAGFLVMIAIAKQGADLGFALLRTYAGEKLVIAFRSKLFRHVQSLSLSYHDTRGTADSTYRIQYDAPAVQWIAIDAIVPLATAVITLLVMIGVMVQIDWSLALVALVVAPLLFLVSQQFSRHLKRRWREAKDLESSTLGVVQEVLSSVRLVKVFAQEEREEQRYATQAGRSMREQLRLSLAGGSFAFVMGVVMALGTAAVLWLGARHVRAGTITLGEFILMMSYLVLLYSPLQTLSRSATSLQGSLVSLERAFSLLDELPEVTEQPNAATLGRAKGHVTFDDVSFSYNGNRPALREISFDVPAGTRVGIAGPTGAGKSTLVSLLLRLFDPESGRILLDGVDLRAVRLRDLRNQFAIVLQEPLLFACTLAENIVYARPDARREEITAAAQAANAHDFIQRLPEGYQTTVGERGVKLSGGERQRISLARAFLKDSPILILDEPTSSVDVQTESTILEAMERLVQGRTTFMIAHRLNTLDRCDLRIQLESGRLASLSRRDAQAAATPTKSCSA